MNKYLFLILCLAAALLLAGCSPAAEPQAEPSTETPLAADTVTDGTVLLDLSAPAADAGAGIAYGNGALTVGKPGTYRLTGAMEGRLVVDADGPVELVLAGASITGPDALYIRSHDPVTLFLEAGTVNRLSDGVPLPSEDPSAEGPEEAEEAPAVEDAEAEPAEEDDSSAAVLRSKAPLTLTGAGSLVIEAGDNNAIRGKDEVTVAGGMVEISAKNHGIKATGVLAVTGGALSVTAGGEALKCEAGRLTAGDIVLSGGNVSLTADDRGIEAAGAVRLLDGSVTLVAEGDGVHADSIAVTGGTLTLDAQEDGLQAAADLTISGGTLSVRTGGGGGQAIQHPGESFGPWSRSSTAAAEPAGSKGLKSGGGVTISGGEVTLDNEDDSIHCGTLFTMDGGSVTICSNDDAIHSDDMLVINDGTLRINDCFEGLEAYAVEVRGGDVVIRAVNDGINANGTEMFFRSSQAESEFTSLSGATTTYVLIAGGRIDLAVTGNTQNQGDGVDSNGAVYITGGETVVSTYGSFMENGLDTGWGGPVVTGGAVIAGGSSTMAEGFSSYSTQCAAVIATSYMPDGTEVVLTDAAGNVLWDVVLKDAFSCIQISHPELQPGRVYTLTYGGQSTTLDFTNTTLIENTRGFGFPGFR